MEGTVEEHELPTSETDSDLNVFLDQREDDITRILEDAFNRHGWVNLQMCLKAN